MTMLPPELQAQAERQWQRYQAAATPEQLGGLPTDKHDLLRAFGLSDFIAESCIRYPELLPQLHASGELEQTERRATYQPALAALLADVGEEEAFKRALRRFRCRHMLVIAWRELLGRAEVEESFHHLSALAEVLICGAEQWLHARLCAEFGVPVDAEGQPLRLQILGMGKLGGGELNFSSDIDLIFSFRENGQTRGGRRTLENQAFFIRLGQQLINALHQPTVDGQVFRVDMRLRPFGEAGPLVVSFAALEDYYQQHGRNWERYAMVKARVLGPASADGQALAQLLHPFVYRRYVDFSAIDALRKMKGMIEAEVRRKGLRDNIKLGAGGIRELEFIVQVYQLIRGGREPGLQVRHLPEALAALGSLGGLPSGTVARLQQAYRFLRRVENVLQEIGDQQTQTLPGNERDRLRLVAALGFADWTAFYQALQQTQTLVHHEFRVVVGESEEAGSGVAQVWQDIWQTPLEQAELAAWLEEQSMAQAPALAEALLRFRQESQRRQMGPQGREALGRLMPALLAELVTQPQPAALFERLQRLLGQIATRTAYLQLLVENPGALGQLLRLCAANALIAQQLARYPLLLDELLDPAQLYHPTPLQEYRDELRQYLLRVPEEDVEQQMEALRQFKQIQLLKISAADIAGALPLMQVSDHLTWLAEAIIEEVVNQAWSQVSARYGVPPHCARSGERGFAVIGYGKLGGIELGYGSDLDLVFLHGDEVEGLTEGARPIDVRQFYGRLAQRILHLFSARTPSGQLYEVDMRLRPSGEAGLLVSSLAAYERYLLQEAWTWEHQALVRARLVQGEPAMAAAFQRIRSKVLSQPRERSALQAEVREMRAKMRTHLLRGSAEQFDLKQGAGGMADIEFMAQFLVLAHAAEHADTLPRWSDNVRIFEACVAAGVLAPAAAAGLTAAYLAIRDLSHRCSLSGESRLVGAEQLLAERARVTALWQQLLETAPA